MTAPEHHACADARCLVCARLPEGLTMGSLETSEREGNGRSTDVRDPFAAASVRAARCTCMGITSTFPKVDGHERHCEIARLSRERDPFPSLSLMSTPARGFERIPFDGGYAKRPSFQSLDDVMLVPRERVQAQPKPEGCRIHPTVFPIGDGKWCCRWVVGGIAKDHIVGYGGSINRAWNAWCSAWLSSAERHFIPRSCTCAIGMCVGAPNCGKL